MPPCYLLTAGVVLCWCGAPFSPSPPPGCRLQKEARPLGSPVLLPTRASPEPARQPCPSSPPRLWRADHSWWVPGKRAPRRRLGRQVLGRTGSRPAQREEVGRSALTSGSSGAVTAPWSCPELSGGQGFYTPVRMCHWIWTAPGEGQGQGHCKCRGTQL